MRDFRTLGGESVAISGGEPLEHPELLSILEAVAGEGIQTTIYTSGTHIGDNERLRPVSVGFAKLLKPLIADAAISLQGATASEHDSFTGTPGSYEATLSSISACQEVGIPVSIHFVPTSTNYQSLPEVVALLKHLRVPQISLLRFVPHGRGTHNALALDVEQLVELRTMVDSFAEKDGATVRLGSPFRILHNPSSPPCTAGIDRLLITPEGTAYPCDAFKGFPYDDAYRNVFATSLVAVWRQSLFLAHVRALTVEISAECRGCRHAADCRGGCLAQRAFSAGALDLVHRDPGCITPPGT